MSALGSSCKIVSGYIKSIDQLFDYVAELKKAKRRLTTNMLKDNDSLSELIEQGKLSFEYSPNEYLNLWYEEWDFYRLLFYFTELDTYKVSKLKKTIVCDLIFAKFDEKNELLVDMLKKQGLIRYADYHKWLKKDGCSIMKYPSIDVRLSEECEVGFYDCLKNTFDIYTDYLPENDEFERYMEDKSCYSIIRQDSNELIGGFVITEKGDVLTEEFLFVDPSIRGAGIADYIYCSMYQKNPNPNAKFAAWIRDDNEPCKKLHVKYNYEMQSAYKITMIKENN